MADWWSEIWALMFPEYADPNTAIGRTAAQARARGEYYESPIGTVGLLPAGMVGSLNSYEEKSPATLPASASPSPTPTTTTTRTAAGDPPASKSDGQIVNSALDRLPAEEADTGPGLYGSLPTGTVYMGRERGKASGHPTQRTVPDGGHPTQRTIPVGPVIERTMGVQDAIAEINDWDPKKIERFRELAVKADFKDPGPNLENIERIWAGLVVRSAKMYEKGIKLSPWQLLNRYATGSGVGHDAAGPKTVTSTSTVVDLTEPKTARALVDQMWAERFGRAPTEKERKTFVAALNEYERKNPKTTTTTTTTAAGGESVTSSSTSKGGVNPSAFAQDYSLQHNKDEAGQYQALTVYMPAFFDALSAPV